MKNFDLIMIVSLAVACVSPATATSGRLDPSFGHGGIVITGFGNDARPIDATLQADGKPLVVGGRNDFHVASEVAVVVRYLPDGTLDDTFGRHGVVTDAISAFENEAEAVVVQSDGKIVILERASSANGAVNDFWLVRLSASGMRDASFGSGGRAIIVIPHPATFSSTVDTMVLQADQSVLVGGSVVAPYRNPTPTKTVLARMTKAGKPDITFGTHGVSETVSIGAPAAMAVLHDGTILAVNDREQTAQYTQRGVLFPTVLGGTVASGTHRGTMVFRPDGDIVVAAGGQGPSGENDTDVSVHLVKSTGGIDAGFQSPLFDFGAPGPYGNLAQAIALGPTGEIAVGGLSQTPSFNDEFGVARLNMNGSLDQHFAQGGAVTTSFPHGGQVLAILIQADGKIVAVGQSFSGDTAIPVDFALVRYLTQ